MDTIKRDIHIDDKLAMSWMEQLLKQPEALTSDDFLGLAACHYSFCDYYEQPFIGFGPKAKPHVQQMFGVGKNAMPLNRLIDYDAIERNNRGKKGPSAYEALIDALTSPTNLPANFSSIPWTVDSVYHSRPITSVIKTDQWELVDLNKNQRKNAFGKKAKAKYPPKMVLRAKGAPIPSHLAPTPVPGKIGEMSHVRGANRIPVPGAKTVKEALDMTRINKFKWISNDVYELLGKRAMLQKVGGPLLTFAPAAAVDVYQTGVYKDAGKWREFAVASAKSQSSNMAGFLGGIAGAALLTGVGVTAAPVLIVGGFVVGIAAQAGFGYFMLDDLSRDTVEGFLK